MTSPGLHSVERPYGKDWAIVMRGSLTECYAWIQDAMRASGSKNRKIYRVLGLDGRVLPMAAEAGK